MKRFFISAVFLSLGVFAFAGGAQAASVAADEAARFNLQPVSPNILDESDDIKSLALKYDSAEPAKKPAVKKEIEKIQTQQEEDNIKAQELRIKRQEDKIKELRAKLEERKKNKAKTVKEKVERIISKDSVEKIKAESKSKRIKDKIKSKAK